MALTDKRKRFIEEYTKDFNGSAAAIRAGYSKDRANVTSSEILSLDEAQEYLEELMSALREEDIVTKRNILEKLKMIAERSSVDEKHFNSAIKAYGEISKMLGFYEPDKIEHSGEGITINYNKPKK